MGFATLWSASVFVSMMPYDDVTPGIRRLSEVVILLLLFPLGALSGEFVRTGPKDFGGLMLCYGLMVPNLFILGYGSAALIKLLRRILSSIAPAEPDPYARSNPRNPQTEQAVRGNRR